MSGWIVRSGAAVVVCAALSVGARAEPAPVVPVTLDPPSIDVPALPPAADAPATVIGQSLPAPVPSETTGTVIPLPPGVYVGLFGLASAALARRRYLRRR